jgi:hypothetical protein
VQGRLKSWVTLMEFWSIPTVVGWISGHQKVGDVMLDLVIGTVITYLICLFVTRSEVQDAG